MDRLLIIGTGLLGSKLMDAEDFDTFGTYNMNVPNETKCILHKLDIRKRNESLRLVKHIDPQYIVHTAAITNVDYCEEHKGDAEGVNAEGTRNIADAAKEIDAKLIYVSTDYVFDGEKGMYNEDAPTNPINYYGESKLAGENIVNDTCEDSAIVRTSVLYGHNQKPNFATWVVDELRKGKEIRIVRDQYNSPTLADDLAHMIVELIKRDETGTFHASGSERINRFDFVINIAEVFGLNQELVIPIKSHELNWKAKRPMDSSLDISKISRFVEPLNAKQGLKRMVTK